MISVRTALVVAAVSLLALGGCSDSSDESPKMTGVQGAAVQCVDDYCDNSDPSKTGNGCDGSTVGKAPITVSPDTNVTIGGFKGTISLRKSNPDVCSMQYWSLVKPAATNKAAFSTWIEVGHKSIRQESEPGRPDVPAWSATIHGKTGQSAKACISVGKETFCTDPVSVVA